MNWMVEEFYSREDMMELFVRGRDLSCGSDDSFVVVKDIKKGCVGLHCKMVKEIRKKYKDKGDEYIEKLV